VKTRGALVVAVAVIGLGMLLGGLRVNPYVYFAGYVVLQYVVIATAWNVLGGYAGYVNFGTPAFFALGAYTSIALLEAFRAPLPVLILCGGLVAGLLGLGIGYLTLRLKGVFFSIATFALSVVLQTLIINWEYVGGAKGYTLIRPPVPLFRSWAVLLFILMVVLAVVTVLVARTIERSWIGRGLAALRDNEEAAECMGVPTLRLKLFATTISGFFLGVAGAPFPYYVTYVEPSSAFDLNYAVNALAMPMIGGTTTWIGPVIGAVLLGTAQQVATVTISSELNLLIVGVVLVLFVVLAPEGLTGLVRKLRRRRA
jgi:branched-chain amino acid transport system permease protein